MMARTCGSANLRHAARVVTSHYDRALKPTGITATQLPLLAAIHNGSSSSSISSLAETLHLERTTVSRELSGLCRRKLVATATGTEDRRTTTLHLTAAGERALSEAFVAWRRAHKAVVAAYGDDAFRKLLENMRQLGTAVKKLAARPRRA
jgi:DNA-binding MarR family transcriptional regulator